MGKHSHTSSGLGGFMSGASIRFSKMKSGTGGADAWRDQLASAYKQRSGGASRARTTGVKVPALNTVHSGTVVSVQDFGAFVQLGNGDTYKDGLLHISCLAGFRPERVEEVVDVGSKIWVKVSEVKHEEGKYSLDMRYVHQKDGKDLDPYHTKGRLPDNGTPGQSKDPPGAGAKSSSSKELFAPAGSEAMQATNQGSDSEDDGPPRKKRKKAAKDAASVSEDLSDDDESVSDVEELKKKMKKKLKKAAKKLEKARRKAEKAKAKKAKKSKKKKKSSDESADEGSSSDS